jgi:two-component system chemotaxis response regulator CheY
MSLQNLKVLVVDDQQSMRALARQCLTRMGLRHITAVPSAEAAIQEIDNNKFDLIISDLNMEGMTGMDLHAKVRNHPITKSTPFLLATSECYKPEGSMGDGSGFVAKPFSVAALKTAMDEVMKI